jgi:hypothetical protein
MQQQLWTLESGIESAQSDGTLPDIMLAAHASGEQGISLLGCCFEKGLRAWGTNLDHMIFLTLRSSGPIACRIDDAKLDHVAAAGNLTVCPEGALCTADGGGEIEGLILTVPKGYPRLRHRRAVQGGRLLGRAPERRGPHFVLAGRIAGAAGR